MGMLAAACGGDDDKPASTTAGGQTGTGGAGNPSGGSAGTSGGQAACDLSGQGLTKETLPTQITADTTLTHNKVWVISDTTYVASGATLTIEPCTRVEGNDAPLGTLVVSRGGKIMAQGTADQPILFTSEAPVGSRQAGDWGGVIVLGRAPNFEGENVTIEGLTAAPENQYGGTDPADNSGVLRYVRIEYAGYQLSQDNEINGLTMGSVGSGTTIDHVMVTNTADDCFEWFGGTVNASYLVCNNGGDDMFDMDQGYQGHLQFLFGRLQTPSSANPNGFECDSSLAGLTPVTTPLVSNVTLCGTGTAGTNTTYGAVLREGLHGTYTNVILTGFQVGIDARDPFGTPAAPNVEFTHSIFFNNFGSNVSNAAETDNDGGFDENAWITDPTHGNSTSDPGFVCGPTGTPDPRPAAAIAGGTPPTGLDTTATYVGAFKDQTDTWMTGPWLDWSTN
jgi:hypothetical protein